MQTVGDDDFKYVDSGRQDDLKCRQLDKMP
jgi:hypothetical protein